MKIFDAMLSIVGICILTFVSVPKEKRPRWFWSIYERIKIAEYMRQNRSQLETQYGDYKAKGYPNTRPEDREKVTEAYYFYHHAQVAVKNMFLSGRLKRPLPQLTDTKLTTIGAVLSIGGVLVQLLFL
jgi:hypothetical protein